MCVFAFACAVYDAYFVANVLKYILMLPLLIRSMGCVQETITCRQGFWEYP